MAKFEILFNEPVVIEAENAGDAVVKFAEMIECQDLNRWFYGTTKTKVEREMEELAEFFKEEWGSWLQERYGISEEDFDEIAHGGVEYWYSGNVDGTQYDCLMLSLEDWERNNRKEKN